MAYILFDIGGTNTRVAVSHDLEHIADSRKFKTPTDSFADGIAKIVAAVKDITGDTAIEAAAGGMRGVLDSSHTMLRRDPSGVMESWVDMPLAQELGRHLGCSVLLENDTAVVGLGESHFGAGCGSAIMAYHTVSTGVGGVRIVHGQIDESTTGFEPGHQIIDVDRSLMGTAVPHTLESLVSGAAIEQTRGVKAYKIDQSDPIWNELAFFLSRGLRNTTVFWSPDTIVLGGSMIVGDPRILLEDIRRHTSESLAGVVACPNILDAELGDDGGLYGAMVLLQQRI